MLTRQQTQWQSIVQQRGHADPEQSNAGLHERLIAKIHSLEEKNHGLLDVQTKLRGEIHTLNSDLADMRHREDNWKLDVEREEKHNSDLQKKTEELKDQLKTSKQRVEELEKHLETKKIEAEGQLDLYQEELKKLRISQEKQSANFTEQKNRLEVEVYKKESEIKVGKEEIEKLRSDFKLAQKKLSRIESSRDEVLQQNENLHDEMFRLEHEYKSMLGNKANLEWELINMQTERVVNSTPPVNASTDSGVSGEHPMPLSIHCLSTSPPRYAESDTTEAFSVAGDQELRRCSDGVTEDGVVYSVYGSSEGDVVIFLNDIGVSSKVWNPVICGVQNSYRCVTFDLAGIGDSEETFAFSMSTHIEHLRNVISDLKQCEEVHLIGWGWGALVAIEFSMSHPDLCISVVSINAPMRRYISLSNFLHLAASIDIYSFCEHWLQCQFTNSFLLDKSNIESQRCVDIDGIIPTTSKLHRFQHLLRFLLLRLQEHIFVFFATRELFIPNKHLRHFVRVLFHAFLLSSRRVYYKSYSPLPPLPGNFAIGNLFTKKTYRFIYLFCAFSLIKLFYTNPIIRETSAKFLVINSAENADRADLFEKLREAGIKAQCAELHGLHACFLESSDRFLYLLNAHLGRNERRLFMSFKS